MCDYSLESVQSVKAVKGAKYTLSTFGYSGSKGFKHSEDCAACVPEGTVLRIDVPEAMQFEYGLLAVEDAVVLRVNPAEKYTYHDAVQFEGGHIEKLQQFPVGTQARVVVLGDVSAPEDHALTNPAPVGAYLRI